jgi:hypothetical protein
VGSACTVDDAGDDPCVSAGYQCLTDATGFGSTCQVPNEFGFCDDSVGCVPDSGLPLSCVAGFKGNDGGPASTCVQSCAGPGPAGCFDPIASCQSLGSAYYCQQNLCDPSGGPYFNTCNAATVDGGDGQCLPLSASATGPGLCERSGPVALDAVCQPLLLADGGNDLCTAGDYCVEGTSTFACLQDCVPGDGGTHTCATGQQCYAFGADFGVCLIQCGTGSDAGCPGDLTCLKQGGGGICIPQ